MSWVFENTQKLPKNFICSLNPCEVHKVIFAPNKYVIFVGGSVA